MRALPENERHSGRGSSVSLFYAAAAGVALGAAVALLFAPKKGAYMRRDLAHAADHFRRSAEDMFEEAANVFNDVAERGATAFAQAQGAVDRVAGRRDSKS